MIRRLGSSSSRARVNRVRSRFAITASNPWSADGAPKDPPPAEGEKKDDKPAEPAPAPAVESLKESKDGSTLIIVADTDWLMDDFSVRRFNFLGVQAAEPLTAGIQPRNSLVLGRTGNALPGGSGGFSSDTVWLGLQHMRAGG